MILVSLAFNNPQSARTHPHDIKNEFCLHHVLDAKIVMTAMRCAQSVSEKLEIYCSNQRQNAYSLLAPVVALLKA